MQHTSDSHEKDFQRPLDPPVQSSYSLRSPGAGLPLISDPASRVLIFGSYPGPLSLEKGEYYANPRNRFWKVMDAVLGIPRDLPYEYRTRALTRRGIALWDIVRSCTRSGASDASIRDVVPNEIPAMVVSHPSIRYLVANGRTAGMLLSRYYPDQVHEPLFRVMVLPSTSPANAGYDETRLIGSWKIILDLLD